MQSGGSPAGSGDVGTPESSAQPLGALGAQIAKMLFRQERWPGAVPSDASFIWGPRRTPPENGSAAKPAPSRPAPAFSKASDFSLLLKFRTPLSPPLSILSLLTPLPLSPSFSFSSSSFQRKKKHENSKILILHSTSWQGKLGLEGTTTLGSAGSFGGAFPVFLHPSPSLPQHPDVLLSGSAILDMTDSRP